MPIRSSQASRSVGASPSCNPHRWPVWSYTGFTLEELQQRCNPAINALLAEVDVLIDGRFLEEQRDLTLAFRGSSNQRIIDMHHWRKTGKIKLLYTDT